MALVLEAVGHPEVVVLVVLDAEFFGEPFAGDPRGVLKDALDRAAEMGYERPVADSLAGVGLQPVHEALLVVLGVDGDHLLSRVVVDRPVRLVGTHWLHHGQPLTNRLRLLSRQCYPPGHDSYTVVGRTVPNRVVLPVQSTGPLTGP
ncbi:hypothetical protein BRD09_06235 [Halobacteriales archaeon SW_10_68_16]|nr:MAG: hypothetical protein BRD09_06235 [Halobacteriales archaeon SW_10_68_16]